MWEISSKQSQFLQSKKRVVLFLAGIRSGKSKGLCMKAMMSALSGRTFLLVSFSYPSLRDVILPILKDLCISMHQKFPQLNYEINSSSMTVTIIKGSKSASIMLRSGMDPDTLRGISCADSGIDEAREFGSRYILDVLLGRMSDQADGQCFISSTPKGHNWLDELSKDTELVETIRQSTMENPFLPKEYVEMLLSQYTQQFASQEIYGNVIEFSGGIIQSVWFHKINYIKPLGHAIRYWDVAVSIKKASDFSASAHCSLQQDKLVIHEVGQYKLQYPDLKKKIIETALSDGVNTQIHVEAAGQQQGFIDDIARCPELGNYVIRADKPMGDKANRAMPWAARAQLGTVSLCIASWNHVFEAECDSFTADDSHEHDDMIDAVSGAWQALQGSNDCLIYTSAQVINEKLNAAAQQESNKGFSEAFGITTRPTVGVNVMTMMENM